MLESKTMKYCFIINPAAGNGKVQEAILPNVINVVKKWGADYEIHRTSGPGEATQYAKSHLAANPEETFRFYSCGGDGTAAEILNGLYGAKNAELGIIPAGSGNDYIRNFSDREKFRDIAAQLAGEAVPVDVIKYTYTPYNASTDSEGEETTAYGLNMVNMGFDAKVVYHTQRMKKNIFLNGTGAYIAGVISEFMSYKMSHVVFHPEGAADIEMDILLAGIGSGRFSGGGFDGIPDAVVNDGYLDLLAVVPLTRGEFIRLIGVYHDGKHIGNPAFQGMLQTLQLKSVVIEPDASLIFAVDGEVHYTKKPFTISVAPETVKFVIPDGVKRP